MKTSRTQIESKSYTFYTFVTNDIYREKIGYYFRDYHIHGIII